MRLGNREVLGLQPRLLDPLLHRLARRGCDLELHWALGLVLHHHSASCDLVAVADVSYPEGDKITATQLAVDPEVGESKLARQALHLQAHSKRPDVLELERRLLANDFSLVPRLTLNAVGNGFHHGLS